MQRQNCNGLCYCGNKNSIAKQLVDIMCWKNRSAKYFYDLFGGGGSISFEAQRHGMQVHYNEINDCVYELQKLLIDRALKEEYSKFGILPEKYYNFVGKEDYDREHRNETDKAYNGFINVVYSFGNRFHSSYMYAMEKEAEKRALHKKVMVSNKWDWFRLRELKSGKRIEHLERIGTLEQYKWLKSEWLKPITMSNLSYEQVEIKGKPEEVIIYTDIPYQSSTRDIYGEEGTFDRAKFIDWCKEMADKGYTVYVSEFDFPIGEEVYRKNRYVHMNMKREDYEASEDREEVMYMITKDTKNGVIPIKQYKQSSILDFL